MYYSPFFSLNRSFLIFIFILIARRVVEYYVYIICLHVYVVTFLYFFQQIRIVSNLLFRLEYALMKTHTRTVFRTIWKIYVSVSQIKRTDRFKNSRRQLLSPFLRPIGMYPFFPPDPYCFVCAI